MDTGTVTHARLPSRTALLLAPLLALAAPLRAAASEGDVTTMDPVFVEASSGSPWRHFSGRGFEIISRCPDGFNEAYVGALRKAAAARLALLPASFWGELAAPVRIVLYNREPERPRDPVQSSPIELSWVPAAGSDSVVLSHPVTVGDGDTFINCGNYWELKSDSGDLSADPDGAILLESRVPRFPAWFLQGLQGPCGVFVNRVVRSTPLGDFVVLPSAVWASFAETVAIRNEAKRKDRESTPLRARPMLPLADLFRGAVREDQRETWDAEAALFVRWGLYGSGNRQAFLDFVDEATREPTTEQMFRRRLGMDYAEARRRLAGYLPSAVAEQIRVALAEPPDEALESREAAPGEVARIIGDWGRLEGRSLGPQYAEYRRDCMEQAERQFGKAIARRTDDPLMQAAYGLYELQAGDEQKARAALEAATRAGVVRPRAYVELARLRLEGALPSVQQGIGDLGEADYEGILGLLTTARLQMPAFLGCYTVLARALEHAPASPARVDLAVLDNALRLFPQNAQLAYTVATLHARLGEPDRAAAIIGRAMAFSESEKARTLLATFPAAQASKAR